VRQQYADAYHGNIRASDTKNFQHLTAPSGSYCVSHRGDKLFQNNFLIYNSPRRKNVLCLLFYISAQKKYINSDIHAINDLIISEQFHCRVLLKRDPFFSCFSCTYYDKWNKIIL